MLELRNICAGYAKKQVLYDVCAHFQDASITVIMGPNGAGKSTLLKTAYGLLKPMRGEILLNKKNITPKPRFLMQNGIAFIPQGKRVFRNMSVMENLELAIVFLKNKTEFQTLLPEILNYFPNLREKLHIPAGNLSGGEQQMVALARSLIGHPKMIFMDEPSIGLSPKLINDLFHKIKNLKEETGTAFVIVEHNLKTLLPLTDFAYILEQGKVIYEGNSDSKVLSKMTSAVFK